MKLKYMTNSSYMLYAEVDMWKRFLVALLMSVFTDLFLMLGKIPEFLKKYLSRAGTESSFKGYSLHPQADGSFGMKQGTQIRIGASDKRGTFKVLLNGKEFILKNIGKAKTLLIKALQSAMKHKSVIIVGVLLAGLFTVIKELKSHGEDVEEVDNLINDFEVELLGNKVSEDEVINILEDQEARVEINISQNIDLNNDGIISKDEYDRVSRVRRAYASISNEVKVVLRFMDEEQMSFKEIEELYRRNPGV